jgi:hypothetical protein
MDPFGSVQMSICNMHVLVSSEFVLEINQFSSRISQKIFESKHYPSIEPSTFVVAVGDDKTIENPKFGGAADRIS